MQLLVLFTSFYPFRRRIKTSAWLFAPLSTVLGCVCALGAIPMYLYLPTMWSALVYSIGAAAQMYMTLQLARIQGSLP